VIIGAIATGAVGRALQRMTVGAPFGDVFVRPWLAPFPLAVGALTLALFAFLAAVYLTVEAHDAPLRHDFRRRALASAGAVFVTAFGALLLSPRMAPLVRAGLVGSSWALPLHVATGIAAVTAIWALWTRRFGIARVAAAAQVSCILWGWAFAQRPWLVPPALTIADAAAPRRTLVLVLWALALGALVLLPSLAYLFRVFKRRSAP
jgi:cytochrome d ubiquinol oxidase subunit II